MGLELFIIMFLVTDNTKEEVGSKVYREQCEKI